MSAYMLFALLCGIALLYPLAVEARTLVVDQHHRQASDDNSGTEKRPFKTINRAAAVAMPGDTVLVHAGVYRECINPVHGGEPGKPVTYQAVPGEQVVVKGSEAWKPRWLPHEGQADVYRAVIDPKLVKAYNPYRETLLLYPHDAKKELQKQWTQTTGQIFVNGQMYTEVLDQGQLHALPGTWMTDGESITVHCMPDVKDLSTALVEITVRRNAFRPEKAGLGYIVIRGFTFEHGANQSTQAYWEQRPEYHGQFYPMTGLVSINDGHHWVIEHNTIRYAKTLGLDIGTKALFSVVNGVPPPGVVGYHEIRHNTISDNGQAGIYGGRFLHTSIIGNVIARNCTLPFNTAEEAGMKTHFYMNGHIEGNLFIDNNSFGLWLDNSFQNVRVTRNLFVNNQQAGIFLEMGGVNCVVDNNIIAYTRGSTGTCGGLYIHDANNAVVAHNLFYSNANYGVFMQRCAPRDYTIFPENFTTFDRPPLKTSPCASSDHRFVNNVFYDNQRGAIHWPYPGQFSWGNSSECNLFADEGDEGVKFALNVTGGASLDEIAAAWEKAQTEAGIPAEKRTRLESSVHWCRMSLEQWRMMMGQDTKSVTASFARLPMLAMLQQGPPTVMNFIANEAYWAVPCETVPGVDTDYFGHPIPQDKPLPGPFQQLKKGDGVMNRLLLWPIALAE